MSATTIAGYRPDTCTVSVGVEADVEGDRLESGEEYADHVERGSGTLRVEGVVSDYPTGALVAVREEERGGDSDSYRPSEYARRFLDALVGGDPVDVVTPSRTYERYAVTGLDYDEHPHALRFTLSLRELRTVNIERDLVALVAVPTATAKKDLGVIGALGQSLAAGARDLARDLVGNPVQIFDERGNMAAWYNQRTGEWFDAKGRVVDPYNPDEIRRLKRPDGLQYDPATKQLLTSEGIPLSRTSVGRARGALIQQLRDNNTASGALTRALTPGWDVQFGEVR